MLSLRNLHDWSLRENLLQSVVEVSSDSLSQINGTIQTIIVLLVRVVSAHSAEHLKDVLDGAVELA